MSQSEAEKRQQAQRKRNYSEQLGEKHGNNFLRNRGYKPRLTPQQKGISQGHDATYDHNRTRSKEIDRAAQIVRKGKKGGYSTAEINQAKQKLRDEYKKHGGYIPLKEKAIVVAEFKGGKSRESRSQEQPDWSIRTAKAIVERKGNYANASDAERKEAAAILEAHKKGTLRYEVVSTKRKGRGKAKTANTEHKRIIKPVEHNGLYKAKSQRGLNNIDTLKSYRAKLKDAIERGDNKQEKVLRNKIQKHLLKRQSARSKGRK